MLYHAQRTIYRIDPDYSLEDWHDISWEEAADLIWRRLDYKTNEILQEKLDFIQNNPNEVIIMSGNLFKWIP